MKQHTNKILIVVLAALSSLAAFSIVSCLDGSVPAFRYLVYNDGNRECVELIPLNAAFSYRVEPFPNPPNADLNTSVTTTAVLQNGSTTIEQDYVWGPAP